MFLFHYKLIFITSLALIIIKMRVNVTPRWTHTHRDLGIRIIYRHITRIIRRIACVRVWRRKVLVGNRGGI